VSCRRKRGAPGVLERNEVSAKQADVVRPIVVNRMDASEGVLLEVCCHGLTPRLGSVDG
jgi:hypothetical protein